jgi:hypothetical protein
MAKIQNYGGNFVSMQIQICRADCVQIDGESTKTFDVQYLYNGDYVGMDVTSPTHGNLPDFVGKTCKGVGQTPEVFEAFGDADLYCQTILGVTSDIQFPNVQLQVKVVLHSNHESKDGRDRFVFYIEEGDNDGESPYTASGRNLYDCIKIAETIESAVDYVATESDAKSPSAAILNDVTYNFGTVQAPDFKPVVIITPSDELKEEWWSQLEWPTEDFGKTAHEDLQSWTYPGGEAITTITTIANENIDDEGYGTSSAFYLENNWLYPLRQNEKIETTVQLIPGDYEIDMLNSRISGLSAPNGGTILSGNSNPYTLRVIGQEEEEQNILLQFTLNGRADYNEAGGNHTPSAGNDTLHSFTLKPTEPPVPDEAPTGVITYNVESAVFGKRWSATGDNEDTSQDYLRNSQNILSQPFNFFKDSNSCECQDQTECGDDGTDQIAIARYEFENDACTGEDGEPLPIPEDNFYQDGHRFNWYEGGITPSKYFLFTGDEVSDILTEFPVGTTTYDVPEYQSGSGTIGETLIEQFGNNWTSVTATECNDSKTILTPESSVILNYKLYGCNATDMEGTTLKWKSFKNTTTDALSKCTSDWKGPDGDNDTLHPCRRFKYVRIDPADIDHSKAPETNPVLDGEFYPTGATLCPDASDLKNGLPRYTEEELNATFNADDENFEKCCHGKKSECDSKLPYVSRPCEKWWFGPDDTLQNTSSEICPSGLSVDSVVTAGLTTTQIRSTAQFYVSAGPCAYKIGQTFITKVVTTKTYADGSTQETTQNDRSHLKANYENSKDEYLVENNVEDITNWTQVYASDEMAYSTQADLDEMKNVDDTARLLSKTVTITVTMYENVSTTDTGDSIGEYEHTTDNLLVPAPEPSSNSPLYDNPTWTWSASGSDKWQIRVKDNLPEEESEFTEWSDVTTSSYQSNIAYANIRGRVLTIEVRAYLNSTIPDNGFSAIGTHSVEIYNVYELLDCLVEPGPGDGYWPSSVQIKSLPAVFGTSPTKKDVWAGYFGDTPGDIPLHDLMCVVIRTSPSAPEETALNIWDYDSSHFHDSCECCEDCENGESESSSIQELSCCPEVYQGYQMCEFPEGPGDASSADPVIYIGPASKSKSFAKFITYEGHCYRKFEALEANDNDIIVSYDAMVGTSFCCDDPHICTFFGDKYEM